MPWSGSSSSTSADEQDVVKSDVPSEVYAQRCAGSQVEGVGHDILSTAASCCSAAPTGFCGDAILQFDWTESDALDSRHSRPTQNGVYLPVGSTINSLTQSTTSVSISVTGIPRCDSNQDRRWSVFLLCLTASCAPVRSYAKSANDGEDKARTRTDSVCIVFATIYGKMRLEKSCLGDPFRARAHGNAQTIAPSLSKQSGRAIQRVIT